MNKYMSQNYRVFILIITFYIFIECFHSFFNVYRIKEKDNSFLLFDKGINLINNLYNPNLTK
jgi:hypothetical protein